MAENSTTCKSVAVVGGGVSGLSAAWLLHRHGHKVTLFESNNRCGGHAMTDWSSGYPVDMAFQVFNLTTYPNLVAWFDMLGVDHVPSEMSFSLSVDDGKLEWGSNGGWKGIFVQKKNLLRPKFWVMIKEAIHFAKEAKEVVDPANAAEYRGMSLGNYLQYKGYSDMFKNSYLLPMCASVWSVTNTTILEFPAMLVIRFWTNHHMHELRNRPVWRTVKDRCETYVKRVVSELPDVRMSTPVDSVRSLGPQGPVQIAAKGEELQFDAVILATHADTTLDLLSKGALEGAPAGELKDLIEVLKGVPFADNVLYLHTDESLMPREKSIWASWNTMSTSGTGSENVPACCTYWINRLQEFPPNAPDLFVTANPIHLPDPNKTFGKWVTRHPLFGHASIESQEHLPAFQGRGGVYIAGAWIGPGFHEAGLTTALEVVAKLGVPSPWTPVSTSPKLLPKQAKTLQELRCLLQHGIQKGFLRLILPNGAEMHFGDKHDVNPAVPHSEIWRKQPQLKAVLRILDADFAEHVVSKGLQGFAEAYAQGLFTCKELGALGALLMANAQTLDSAFPNRKACPLSCLWRCKRTAKPSKNQTYAPSTPSTTTLPTHQLFLDSNMCLVSGKHMPEDGQSDVHDSQLRMLDSLVQKLDAGNGSRVLVLGSLWGAAVLRVAEVCDGSHVTVLVCSEEALAEVTRRVQSAGLGKRVDVKLFDDSFSCLGKGKGQLFDSILCCEMAFAMPAAATTSSFFNQLEQLVTPGGTLVLQSVCLSTTACDFKAKYKLCKGSSRCSLSRRGLGKKGDTGFRVSQGLGLSIQRVFGGSGVVCSVDELAKGASGLLQMRSKEDVGVEYPVTLRTWGERLKSNKSRAVAATHTEETWHQLCFDLALLEGAFEATMLTAPVITWQKAGKSSRAVAVEVTCG